MYNGAEKRIGKGRFCREFAVKTNKIMDLNTVKTVVVKIGTSTLTYENGKMNLGLDQVGGQVLVVSQFTLYGNCRKGRRPSFAEAANPELGNALYEKFLSVCEELGYPPQHGRFGADMKVESLNDGPVTLILDTDQLQTPRHSSAPA